MNNINNSNDSLKIIEIDQFDKLKTKKLYKSIIVSFINKKKANIFLEEGKSTYLKLWQEKTFRKSNIFITYYINIKH